jgi:hypothetical protein
MLTIQATAEQAMLAPGLVAVAIVRAVLPAMPPAMHVLTQVRKRMTEAVAATVVPEQEPAHLALAPAYSIGVLTELALAIRDTQAQPAPAAPAAIATMALPAYHKQALAAAAGLQATDQAVIATVQDMRLAIQEHVLIVGVLTGLALATADTAVPLAEQ